MVKDGARLGELVVLHAVQAGRRVQGADSNAFVGHRVEHIAELIELSLDAFICSLILDADDVFLGHNYGFPTYRNCKTGDAQCQWRRVAEKK